jgi:hypothetical protein
MILTGVFNKGHALLLSSAHLERALLPFERAHASLALSVPPLELIKTLAFLLLAAPSQAATQPTASTPATPTPTPTPTTDDGPALDLAPEHTKTPPPQDQPALGIGAGSPSDAELVRGLTEQRFRSASASALSTSVGGYGEIHVRGTTRGREGEREWLADIPRLVVFVAHEFNDSFPIVPGARGRTLLRVLHLSRRG